MKVKTHTQQHASRLSDGLHWSSALLVVGTMAAVGSVQQQPIPKCDIGAPHLANLIFLTPADAY